MYKYVIAGTVLALWVGGANAGVSPEEAATLKTTLTPLGAERAGNKDGTIPAWTGGLTTPSSRTDKLPADQFTAEKPLVQITAQNAGQHADKLAEGAVALLKLYPTYRIDVYPTHRTAAAPQYVYDNTVKNATRAKVSADGQNIEGAFGGVPFPIPKSGIEIYWNHTLRPRNVSSELTFYNWVGTADGQRTLANRGETTDQHPYYYPNGTPETWTGEYLYGRTTSTEPPFKAGEALVARDHISSRQAWQYLVGQRRVRRAPTVGYDTPDFIASGADYFDEAFGFWGQPDRYDWKLVGKKEMYIPYNTNGFLSTPQDGQATGNHPNPDKLRWELHRVWIVDATVAPGKRHAVPKRRFYFDEDTWAIVMVDGFDAEGKLWRFNHTMPFVAPEVPVVITMPTIVYNLQSKTVAWSNIFDAWKSVPQKPDAHFTGDSLASGSVR
ncbi:DUF1329 domain-containing protein [Magnetospirillum sp. 15-1]|uniref:DUF1329 domain-containing protein n=1 Tax=Magnetospirillum sp. 15-1 TaxID=1979370 RepID=UPI000BBBA973|nr:DUF1329 domain-containing protein [Magnetospirillum sp. 15-1]